MDHTIRKAVILAAGRGTRMGELTAEVPKPMLPVHGKPLIQHVLENLETAGLREFGIVTGYQSESIVSFLRGLGFARAGLDLKRSKDSDRDVDV